MALKPYVVMIIFTQAVSNLFFIYAVNSKHFPRLCRVKIHLSLLLTEVMETVSVNMISL